MKSILLVKKFLGLVEMTSGLVNDSFSLPEWQAVKMIFFAPCILSIFDMVFRYLPIFLTVLQYWVPPNVPLSKLLFWLDCTCDPSNFWKTATLDLGEILRV